MDTVIAKIGKDKYKTEISAGNHSFVGDEPVPYGEDLGPSPYDYLLTALGTCICMTVRMYADRKKWPMDSIEVRLSQKRVHHSDCDDCESADGYVHVIEKVVDIKGDLDETQLARLHQIEGRCPVHKTLSKEIVIK